MLDALQKVTIKAVNDAPAITGGTALSVTEGSGLQEGKIKATDVDDERHLLSYAIEGETPAWFSFTEHGGYQVDTDHAEFRALRGGATKVVALKVRVGDGEATTTTTLDITVAGIDWPAAGSPTAKLADGVEEQYRLSRHGGEPARGIYRRRPDDC
ncbi:VCBS domain-containing protein [Sphingomonas sp. MMS24-JH45]